MLPKSYKFYILLFIFFITFTDLGNASPTIVKDDNITESLEEIDDLNKNNNVLRNSSNTSEPSFNHRDEDMIADLKQTTLFARLKYDVEILESSEVKKDVIEIEERYRGPSITLNTDEFINENIEVNADEAEEEDVAKVSSTSNYMILSIILVVLAVVSICLYAALVMWRSHIDQRYGMRELLVTNDNQDYWPQDVITSVVAQHQQQQQLQS